MTVCYYDYTHTQRKRLLHINEREATLLHNGELQCLVYQVMVDTTCERDMVIMINVYELLNVLREVDLYIRHAQNYSPLFFKFGTPYTMLLFNSMLGSVDLFAKKFFL